MSNQAVKRIVAVLALLLAIVLTQGGGASAAPPPKGYPTASVLVYATDPNGLSVPLRRGFWDSTAQTGGGAGTRSGTSTALLVIPLLLHQSSMGNGLTPAPLVIDKARILHMRIALYAVSLAW